MANASWTLAISIQTNLHHPPGYDSGFSPSLLTCQSYITCHSRLKRKLGFFLFFVCPRPLVYRDFDQSMLKKDQEAEMIRGADVGSRVLGNSSKQVGGSQNFQRRKSSSGRQEQYSSL
jgi:hypothetical protein